MNDRAGSPLPQELLEELGRQEKIKTIPKSMVVVVEGETAEALYIVQDGSLSVYVDDESGRVVELTRLGAGDYFGDLMLASEVRTASVKTLTAARVRIIRRGEFELVLRRRPDLAMHVIQTLMRRVIALTDNVRGLALMDVYGRVARLLLDSATNCSGVQVINGMTQRAIADRIGASPSMVNRILKDLAGGGYIELRRGQIELRRGLPRRW